MSQEVQRAESNHLMLVINKPFKNYVCELFEQHLDANLVFTLMGNLQQGKDVS